MKIATIVLMSALPVSASAMSTPVESQQYWGQFRDVLEGVFVDTNPRPSFKLSKKFDFVDPNGLVWSVPSGASVDGASIPQMFWSTIGGPFEGPYLKASVIHDYYCDQRTRTAHDTHRNFYYGMRANNVPVWKAKLMYWAVSTFGPSWQLVPRVVNRMHCINGPTGRRCASVATVENRVEMRPGADLSDPTVLALARSKFAATANTLKNSGGDVLDVRGDGAVSASLDALDANAAAYRDLFTGNDLQAHVPELGALADPNFATIDTIPGWPGGRIPSAQELQPFSGLGPDARGKAFTLAPKDVESLKRGLDIKMLESTMQLRVPS